MSLEHTKQRTMNTFLPKELFDGCRREYDESEGISIKDGLVTVEYGIQAVDKHSAWKMMDWEIPQWVRDDLEKLKQQYDGWKISIGFGDTYKGRLKFVFEYKM